tara:strand:- start:20298 stop:20804 length:507 start_codon:yes stop_codon:yes gene_type:complete
MVTPHSRISLWLGLVLAALTSLLPMSGVTVCFGHEAAQESACNYGHDHEGHGLALAVGIGHATCVCITESAGPGRDTACTSSSTHLHECQEIAIDRPVIESADGPLQRDSARFSGRIVQAILTSVPPGWFHGEFNLDRTPMMERPQPLRDSIEPLSHTWLERSTVLRL